MTSSVTWFGSHIVFFLNLQTSSLKRLNRSRRNCVRMITYPWGTKGSHIWCHRSHCLAAILDRQPRAFWSNEGGTNIWVHEHLVGCPSYTDMDVCRGTSAACGPWWPPKRGYICIGTNIIDTRFCGVYVNKYIVRTVEWPLTDILSAVFGPPDAQKGAKNLAQIKHWKYHINPNSNE